MLTSMCRVCRGGSIRLRYVENTKLVEIYEKLTGTKFSTDDGRPQTLCYICHMQLQKCCRFADMANRSEMILTDLLGKGMQSWHVMRREENHVTRVMDMNVDSHKSRGRPEKSWMDCMKDEKCILSGIKISDILEQVEHEMVPEYHGLAHMPLSPVQFLTDETDEAQESSLATVKIEQYTEGEADFEFLEIEDRSGRNEFIDVEVSTGIETAVDQFEDNIKTADCEFYEFMDSNSHIEKKTDLKVNMENSLTNDTQSYVFCNFCNKKFAFKYQLISHLMVHTEMPLKSKCNTEKRYACDKCKKTFTQESKLKIHIKSHLEVLEQSYVESSSSQTSFSCKICDQAFPTKLKLTTHILTHSEEWTHVCKVCEKAFNKQTDLQTHMTNHKKNPYLCKICDRYFPKLNSYQAHMKTHTANKHTCKVCKKGFAVPAYLKRHMQIHDTERPSFPCLSCDKIYSQKCHLLEHMRTHNGVRPHTCKICDRTFTYRSTLRNHMVTHTGEKPYPCTKCDAAFSQTSTLKRHLRLIHSVK